jgi:hypothetical protein
VKANVVEIVGLSVWELLLLPAVHLAGKVVEVLVMRTALMTATQHVKMLVRLNILKLL